MAEYRKKDEAANATSEIAADDWQPSAFPEHPEPPEPIGQKLMRVLIFDPCLVTIGTIAFLTTGELLRAISASTLSLMH